MGLNNFILTCERESKELKKDLEYYKNQNARLKKQLEVGKEQYNDLVEEKESLQEQLSSNTLQLQTQQKEFIKYLEDKIENKRLNATCTTEYTDYVIPLKDVLQKYKEIIGDDKK